MKAPSTRQGLFCGSKISRKERLRGDSNDCVNGGHKIEHQRFKCDTARVDLASYTCSTSPLEKTSFCHTSNARLRVKGICDREMHAPRSYQKKKRLRPGEEKLLVIHINQAHLLQNQRADHLDQQVDIGCCSSLTPFENPQQAWWGVARRYTLQLKQA